MTTVLFRFYSELNALLSEKYRFRDNCQVFQGSQTVKHLLESLGIPHTEVDLILVNGTPVNFSYIPNDGERISVYPVFESFDISTLNCLRPDPLREPQFVLDGHLGRLAAYLRMLGFNSLYHNDYSDEALAQISDAEKRILLTRDRGLLKRRQVTRGYLLRTCEPKQQLLAVIRRFDLVSSFKPFTRCIACNGILIKKSKEAIIGLLEPRTIQYFEKFKQCADCGKIYWKGSHYERMLGLIDWAQKGSMDKCDEPVQPLK
jgi:uncharacterized protein with PIN domain/sulfur carrier protein ThiS